MKNQYTYTLGQTGYADTSDMHDDLVEKINTQTSTQGSAILKVLYYNPKNLTVQHLPVKEKVKKFEMNHMRKGYVPEL